MPYKDPQKIIQYRKEHKEYFKEWSRENPEKRKLYKKRNREKHLEKNREKDRGYHQKWTQCQICKDDIFGYRKKFCDKCRHIYRSNKYKGNQFYKFVKNRPRGSQVWNWKGGITPLKEMIYRSRKYQDWRKSIFKRDNYTCQNCNNTGGYLEAHHIKQFIFLLEENSITSIERANKCDGLWDIALGQTLCRKCHNITKNGKPKLQRTT